MQSDSSYFDSIDEVLTAIKAHVPLIWVNTHEETRFIASLLNKVGRSNKQIYSWSINEGLRFLRDGDFAFSPIQQSNDTKELKKALEFLITNKSQTNKEQIYLLKDLHLALGSLECRTIRDVYSQLENNGKILLGISPVLAHGPMGSKDGLPPTLEKSIVVLEYKLPSKEDIFDQLKTTTDHLSKENSGKETKFKLTYSEQELIDCANSLSGLTITEIDNSINMCFSSSKKLDPRILLQNKRNIIKKSGLLEYVDYQLELSDVGGLDKVKEYLVRYKASFSKEARDFGVEPPKAILLVGIPGAGKSTLAKTLGNIWKIPLLRFDIGRVMSRLVGESEQKMRDAIRICESVAPVGLWIDEVEKGLSGTKSSGNTDGGTLSRVFGTLLTSMQDGMKDVVIVATSNDISALPPEFIRRFNEVFFVDLPSPEERWEILSIHLGYKKYKIEEFEKEKEDILSTSEGYTGDEIGKAVKDALARAYYSKQSRMTAANLISSLSETKPISKIQSENIIALQQWAKGHARFASSYSERKLLGLGEETLAKKITNRFSLGG